MEPPETPQPATDAEDQLAAIDFGDLNLPCPKCGYNLRGQTGRSRRCPECGEVTSIAHILCPPADVRKQQRRLETWATVPAFAAVCVVLSLVFADPEIVNGCACIGFGAFAAVCFGIAVFRNFSDADRDWLRLLGAWSGIVLWQAAAIATLIVLIPMITERRMPTGVARTLLWVAITLPPLSLAVGWRYFRRLRRRLDERFTELAARVVTRRRIRKLRINQD